MPDTGCPENQESSISSFFEDPRSREPGIDAHIMSDDILMISDENRLIVGNFDWGWKSKFKTTGVRLNENQLAETSGFT
jgi:hypothetical protein